MPTTELFVVDSAGVTKKVSKLSARFYRYEKQIAAGNMDPMSRVSVDTTHPAVTAARRRSGKAAMARETPPTRTSPPRLAKAIFAAARSTGLACSGASLARTVPALACSSIGSASASGSNLNLPAAAKPPLSKVSEDEDEDDDDDGSEMIIGNLFPQGPGVAETGGVGDEYGEDGEEQEGSGEDDNLDFTNIDDADSVPNAEVNKYSFVERLRFASLHGR